MRKTDPSPTTLTGSRDKIQFEDTELTTNTAETDPSRLKRMGFVSAKPSEFLIVYRRGRLREKVSGQGARCFKWPGDTVAIVPTTLKEVIFQANQITLDNVDVRLRGLVIYRISEPLKIYKLINFSQRQEAEAKLARMIADMCRSIAKWLVANMNVEECVRRRKEEIAGALKREISSVVSSSEESGWGVDVVTIDIHDIYIQDNDLFRALQARFKTEKEREAELARIEAQREIEKRSLSTQKELEEDRHALELEKARLKAKFELEQIALRTRSDEDQFRLDRFRVEQNEGLQRYKLEQNLSRDQLAVEAEQTQAAIKAAAQRILSEEEIRTLKDRLAVEDQAGPASLERLFYAKALPELAQTLAKSMNNMQYNVFQSAGAAGEGGSPVNFVLQQLLGILQQRVERKG
jgi:hypothetical protein